MLLVAIRSPGLNKIVLDNECLVTLSQYLALHDVARDDHVGRTAREDRVVADVIDDEDVLETASFLHMDRGATRFKAWRDRLLIAPGTSEARSMYTIYLVSKIIIAIYGRCFGRPKAGCRTVS